MTALISLLGRAQHAFRKVSLVVGWPNLLLCSAAGTLVAALVVLTATPIVRALISKSRFADWETASVWGVWGGGLLASTTVGALLGVRVGSA